MNEAVSANNKSTERRARTVIRKIAAFEKRFGQPHLYLLYHAAFPLALTPDLLYRLWANFQRDINGRFCNIPWIAVSDLLLSSLCEEVGQELYEMDEAVRRELLERLLADANFGQQRIQELSDFLLEYVRQQLQSNDPDIRDFAEAQQWTVLAYTRPGNAARAIALAFQRLGLEVRESGREDKTELIRMTSLANAFADPLAEAGLEPLLVYVRGMANWARGNTREAARHLEQITKVGKIQIAGVELPIPRELENHSETLSLPIGPDYSGQNLRGRSFKGQDLTGANFSDADIRGTNFTHATLIGANFSRAKTGLQRRWATGLLLFSLLFSILSGLLATLVSALAGLGLYLALDNLPLNNAEIIFTCTGATGFIGFLILCMTTLSPVLKAGFALLGSFLLAGSLLWIGDLLNLDVAIASSWIALVSVSAGAIARATTIAIAVTVNLTWAEAENKAMALGWTVVGTLPSIIGGVIVALSTLRWLSALGWERETFLISVGAGSILAGAIVILGAYLGWRALVNDQKFTAIRDLATAFAAKGGTSFRGANLTDANFTEASLKSADFREANLTRTCWFHAQKLDRACVANTYLQAPQVQQLAITGIGQEGNFNFLDLQGINLQEFNLADASFIGTNLSEANLQYTNLSRAKLIETQLDEAHLFAACLTGACIKEVKITTATQLQGVECQYIFTRLPTRENRDPGRIPQNYSQIFKPVEFADFMRQFYTQKESR